MSDQQQPEGYEYGRTYTAAEISRKVKNSPRHLEPTTAGRAFAEQMLALVNEFEQNRRAEIIAAGGDPDEDRDPFEHVRDIADAWADTADDAERRAVLLDQLAARLDTSEVRALRLAAEAAAAITPRLIYWDADHGVSPAQTADDLGMSEGYVYRILRKRPAEQEQERPTVRIAYDFGDELHVMDVDGQGVYVNGTAEVIAYRADRDAALTAAGYRTVGDWTQHGEAEGVTVERA